MRTGTVLDMDMTSLAAAMRGGWDWWTEELARMVPERLRGGTAKLSGPVAQWAEDGTLRADGAALDPVPEGSRRRLMHVELPPGAVMVREALLPRVGSSDLARLVAFELDRLLPFPPGTAIAAARALPGGSGAKAPTLVAAMPLNRAAEVLDGARAAGVEPLGLLWRSPDDTGLTLDLLPALVASGRVTPRRDGRPFWWGLVAALFIANVGLLVWRDVAATDTLAAEVAEQQTASAAARAVAARIAGEESARAALLAERKTHDPLAMLALTTGALPANAFVQRFAWTAETLRLTGYKEPGSDVQAALRRSGRFAALQSSVSDPTAEGGGGQPFDISAEIAGTNSAAETRP